jgi:hypothetical protein
LVINGLQKEKTLALHGPTFLQFGRSGYFLQQGRNSHLRGLGQSELRGNRVAMTTSSAAASQVLRIHRDAGRGMGMRGGDMLGRVGLGNNYDAGHLPSRKAAGQVGPK